MATFVSLATCHCPITSTRHGLVYRDSLSALSRNLGVPRCPRGPRGPPSPRLQDLHSSRLTRADLPEPVLLSGSRPSSSMKHLVVAHLRRLLTLNPAHRRRRGLRLQG